MTEVKNAGEHPLAKLGLQVFQALLIAAAIGSYTAISSSLETIKNSLSTIQIESALSKQRLDTLERSATAVNAETQAMKIDVQKLSYDVEALKGGMSPKPLTVPRDKNYR